MQSPRTLGIFALVAVILAAISFAVVDVSIADANGCVGASDPCTDSALPLLAVMFAVLGSIMLLASVLPAITWFIDTIHHARHDADIEPVHLAASRTSALESLADEDLV